MMTELKNKTIFRLLIALIITFLLSITGLSAQINGIEIDFDETTGKYHFSPLIEAGDTVPYNLVWIFGDGYYQVTNTLKGPAIHSFDTSGNYAVRLYSGILKDEDEDEDERRKNDFHIESRVFQEGNSPNPKPTQNESFITLKVSNDPRQDYDIIYAITYVNNGEDSIEDAVLHFDKDHELLPVGLPDQVLSYHEGVQMTGKGGWGFDEESRFTVALPTIGPGEWGRVFIRLRTSKTVGVGFPVTCRATLIAGQSMLDTKELVSLVAGQWDPNDIFVSPPQFYHPRRPLTYTICFQNMGNTVARDVELEFDAGNNLDLGTLQAIGCSHPQLMGEPIMSKKDGKVTWKFKGINLTSVEKDVKKSQGYLTIRLHPRKRIKPRHSIETSAMITMGAARPFPTGSLHNRHFEFSEPLLVTHKIVGWIFGIVMILSNGFWIWRWKRKMRKEKK